MKMHAEGNDIVITECFSGVGFRTKDGEELAVCMRDTGFEINYNGEWFEAKDNKIIISTPHAPNIIVEKDNGLPNPPNEDQE